MVEIPFYKLLLKCDLAISSPPSAEAVKDFLELIRNPILLDYGFQNLDRPDWLDLLINSGYFDRLPESQEAKNFLRWPSLSYLERVGQQEPDRVLGIVSRLEPVPNYEVAAQVARIIRTLPTKYDKEAGAIILGWLKQRISLGYRGSDFSELITHFTDHRQSKIALSIAGSLLRLERRQRSKQESKNAYKWDEPVTIVERWDYSQILSQNIPVLANVAPFSTLRLICRLLSRALNLSADSPRSRIGRYFEDYSYIWREDLESADQDSRVKDILASTILRTARQIIDEDPNLLKPVVEFLEKEKWAIFYRTSLHLLSIYPEENLIRDRLLRTEYYGQIGIRREFEVLLSNGFMLLSDQQRHAYVEEANRGLRISKRDYEKRIKQFYGGEVSKDAYEMASKEWTRDRLYPVRSYLKGRSLRQFQRLTEELGPKKPLPTSGVYWSSETLELDPDLKDELRDLSVKDLIMRLTDPDDPLHSRRDQVVSELTDLCSLSPRKFAPFSGEFIRLPSAYLLAFVEGFRRSTNGSEQFDWYQVLVLFQSYLEQFPNLDEEEPDKPDQKIVQAIASIMFDIFKQRELELPRGNREVAWNVLRTLVTNSNPTPEYESQFLTSNTDPATLSINTIRGQAMHAVIQYALWINRIEGNLEDRIFAKFSFAELNEVEAVLSNHLLISVDPSISIRAVYGQWLPWLIYLDSQWVKTNLKYIFPEESDLKDYRNAAWHTYLAYSPAYDSVFDLIREEYKRAIERVPQQKIWRIFSNSPDINLGQHLAVMYWRGKVGLDDNSLLVKFFERATDEVRHSIMGFAGDSLRQAKEEIPTDILSRLRTLWEWRRDEAIAKGVKGYKRELESFGSWLLSKKFSDAWSFDNLEKVASTVGSIDDEYFVIKEMAASVHLYPTVVAKSLKALLKIPKERFRINGAAAEIRQICSTSLRSDEPEAVAIALETIDDLLSKGYFEFRNLIDDYLLNVS